MPSGDLPVRASYPRGAGLPLPKKRQSSWMKQHTVPGLSFSASRDFPILEHTSSTLHRSSMKFLGSRRKSATESEFSSAAAAPDNRDINNLWFISQLVEKTNAFFKNVIPAPATRLRGHRLRRCKLIPAQAREGIQSSPSFPCFHRGRLCGSRNPEISKCDFICIYLYWIPATRLRGNKPRFPLPRE